MLGSIFLAQVNADKPLSRLLSRILNWTIACALTVLTGCAAAPIDEASQAAIEKIGRDSGRLLVVDCLLPGQVRQLGTRLTYQTPRRPVKTSANDCEVRGGEYVAYDRANFSTSLNIWLPRAKEGDPEAQTYVGEIFERGLGTQTDFSVAADWYRKAADQGYSRAQINLGYLLESGLGVEKNLTEAMNLYRAASGVSDGEIEYVTSAEIVNRQQAREELSTLRDQVVTLQQELNQRQQQLQTERQSVASLRLDVEQERKQAIEALKNAEAREVISIPAKTLAEIEQLESTLEQSRSQQVQLQQKLAQQSQATQAARNQYAEANRDLIESTEERDRIDSQLQSTRQRLQTLATDSTDQQRQLAQNVAALERQLDQQRQREQSEADLNQQKRGQLEQQVADLNGQLEQQRQREQSTTELGQQQQSELKQQLADLNQQLEQQRQLEQNTTAQNQQQRGQLEQQVADLNQQLASQRQTEQSLSARNQQQQRELEQNVAASSQQQEQQRLLEESANQLTQQLEKQTALVSRLRDQQSASSSALESEVDRAEQLASDTQSALDQKVAEVDALQVTISRKVSRYEAEIASLNSRLAGAQTSNEALVQNLEYANLSAQQLEQEKSKLTAELDQQQLAGARAATERARLVDALKTAELAVEQQGSETSALISQVTEVEQQLNGSQQEQLRLQDKLLDLELTLADVSAENRDKQQEFESVISQREQTVDQQQREIERLSSEINDARGLLATAVDPTVLTALQGQLDKQQVALKTAQSEQTRLTDKLMDVQIASSQGEREGAARLAELEARLAASEQALASRELELESFESQVTQAESQVTDTNADRVTNVLALGPAIEIIEPPQRITRGLPSLPWNARRDELTIIGKVNPVQSVLSLSINGQPIDLNESGVFRYLHNKTDGSKLNIVAVSNDGERNQADFSLDIPTLTPSAAPEVVAKNNRNPATITGVNFGNYYALIVGNNNYPQLTNLRSAENDAIAIESVLRNKYGFKTELLLNATRADLLSALESLRKTLTRKDNLLIYYAGHGELDQGSQRGYWLPVDASPSDNSNWISNKSITDSIDAMKAKHVMVVADSCYSGTLTRTAVPRRQQELSAELTTRWYKVVSNSRVRVVLSSGGVRPVYDSLGDSKHSLFAKAFINELNNNENILEGYDLYTNVQSKVTAEARTFNVEQDPLYAPIKHAGHEAGEFFFLPQSDLASDSASASASLLLQQPPGLLLGDRLSIPANNGLLQQAASVN